MMRDELILHLLDLDQLAPSARIAVQHTRAGLPHHLLHTRNHLVQLLLCFSR
jgi:hypothetical protein